MTDYAGPILGAVGAVVGFYIGGPTGAMYGWSIGMTVGGAYATSQQVIPGPKIGDTQKQTAQEGGFRPIIYGRSLPLMGNVIADSEPVIVPGKVSSGKGGPKQQAGESAFRTYAVGFCEGETTLLQAWRNGILVYDAEDPSMAAENAKFLGYATWYTGSFEQMPDPDLEAIYGAGNTPFFRGTSYLVLASEDVTDQRGAWSQWQVRVFRGARARLTTPPYVLEAWMGEMSAHARLAGASNINTSALAGSIGTAVEVSAAELRLMSVAKTVRISDLSAAAEPTAAEMKLMQIQKSALLGSIDATASPAAAELKQTTVVLNTVQPNNIDSTCQPTAAELIIP